jgi:Protein of unknown function (DUF2752)
VTRRSRLGLVGLLAAIGALVPRPVLTHLPTTCPIRRVTGYPCPSCGMVRSWHSVAQLDPVQAVRDHPFGPIALVAMTAEAWRPGIIEREMRRAGRAPAIGQVGVLGAWFAWWASRLVAERRRRSRRRLI